MPEAFIPEYFLGKNKYRRKPQMSFMRAHSYSQLPDVDPGPFEVLWASLTVLEKEQWNDYFRTTGYAGFIGAFWVWFKISTIFTIIWLKDTSVITEAEFKALLPPNWWDFVLILP